jgi:tripartite-type tricarboxylate transporter receptor subunit TctC
MSLAISMFAAGRAVFMPSGVDAIAGAALRKAFGELNSDAEFQKSAANLNGGSKMDLTDGDSAQSAAAAISHLVKADPAALAYLEHLAENVKAN